jgi:hypothetical protein
MISRKDAKLRKGANELMSARFYQLYIFSVFAGLCPAAAG